MRAKIVLLYPFDMGLELDFTGKDALEFFKEITARKLGVLSFEGTLYPQAEFSTQVYRFGVGLIQISFVIDSDINAMARFAADVEKIRVGKAGITAYCHSLVEGLIQRAARYATYRYDLRLTEEELFPVVILKELPDDSADTFIERHHKAVFGLVSGEQHYELLSRFALEQDKLTNFGYYEKEIVLIKRFGALVFSEESSTILEMIKLAFAQYWSMRSYNFILDRELDTSQKLLEHLPPFYEFWRIPKSYQRFSTESLSFDRDKISIVDSLYNVIGNISKVESDWHLRSLYENVRGVFDVEEQHRIVETKIGRIAESYNSAREYLSTNFFILLDIIFFLSLAWSIIDTFLLWKLSVK